MKAIISIFAILFFISFGIWIGEKINRQPEVKKASAKIIEDSVVCQFDGSSNDYQRYISKKEYIECMRAAKNGEVAPILGFIRQANRQGDVEGELKWIRHGAELGVPEVNLLMGMKYLKGDGVIKNDDEAWNQLLLASSQGNSFAYYLMALQYEKEETESEFLEQLEESADRGNCLAANRLTKYYLEKYSETKKKDFAKKAYFWRLINGYLLSLGGLEASQGYRSIPDKYTLAYRFNCSERHQISIDSFGRNVELSMGEISTIQSLGSKWKLRLEASRATKN